ncbi:alpha/beta hydrolase fold domain-containing protein [Nocardioides sp. W7]|uniref:alpha/beta hydrolase fold domain-containing protein n=1 Tax=Nocardioides sp. W7 TaxID=2931390 RepID=UPI002468A36B|nr:alpha/beta hydrolase fold domain-containing protein [Nocardioides sp. W7]
MDGNTPGRGVRLEERWVPFPTSISAEARRNLAAMIGPDGRPAPQPTIAPDDHDGWTRAKAFVRESLVRRYAPQVTGSTRVSTVELGGAVVHVATPEAPYPDDRAYLELHGGALVYGEGEACRLRAMLAAEQHGVTAYAVDYRMPPEHPYPAALDDCLGAYAALLETYAPENIVVGGASAGGNLAAALALRARDEGLPLPAALVLLTPELDLTESGDSFETNQLLDVVLAYRLTDTIALYAREHDLTHPYLSPLFGDFEPGFPRTFVQAGTRDLFLSNAVRMHRALRRASVPVELHVSEGMPHGGFMGAPEDDELRDEVQRFVGQAWGRPD